MINTLSILYFFICGLVCILLPLAMAVYMRKSCRAAKSPLAAGAVLYLAFVILAKQYFDKIFFGLTGLGGDLLSYTVVAGLTAALFECGGRIVGFRVFMPKNRETERTNAVVYGIGHGGLDIIVAIGINMLAYGVFSLIFNRDPDFLLGGANGASWEEIRLFLCQFSPVKVLWFTVEAVSRLTAQIAVSVLVFAYVQKKKWGCLAAGALVQAAISIVLSLSDQVLPLAATELLLAALAAVSAVMAYRAYSTIR